jgi:acetyl-CoA carboxylase biotin carboxyl carrier protein
MLTFEQIKELVELVGRHGLQNLELERSGFRLSISGERAAGAAGAAPAAVVAEVAQPAAVAPSPVAEAPASDVHVVNSPIVGTFYTAPSPDSGPYVRVGDRVRRGQVLCIVEAMKLMNEIESDVDGVITEIYPKNAQPVEFGEPLFGLKRD